MKTHRITIEETPESSSMGDRLVVRCVDGGGQFYLGDDITAPHLTRDWKRMGIDGMAVYFMDGGDNCARCPGAKHELLGGA